MAYLKQSESSGSDMRFMDGYTKNKKRDHKELTSRDTTNVTGKELKSDEKAVKPAILSSAASSSASNQYSIDTEGTLVGIICSGDKGKEEVGEAFKCLSHGSMSVIGRRRAMEDALSVVPEFLVGEFESYDFFAVYDGHGGSVVANACRDRLHRLLAKEMEGWKNGDGGGKGVDWGKVMAACFKKMDEEVAGCCGLEPLDKTMVAKTLGSTAVVVVVGKEEVVVANCGDSRAVLCRGSIPVALSCDHKPDRPDEKERLEAVGGTIMLSNDSCFLGLLGTSRAIGDQSLKPYVIADPEVTVSERTESDHFILIGSDGLWDVVSNEVACELARKCLDREINRSFSGCLDDSAAEAATILAELAIARGSKDNISVIVVELKKSS